jgi:hypothetical protein
MTQHEYIFIAVSIILGLAITRLLNNAAMLLRGRDVINFHWSSAIWAFSIMLYILQLWWVFGCSCLYGASEMALSEPGEEGLDMLRESQRWGRLSALFMLMYFFVGPYINIVKLDAPVLPSLIVPAIGIVLMALVISVPRYFRFWSVLFFIYSMSVLVLTV